MFSPTGWLVEHACAQLGPVVAFAVPAVIVRG
jgi:hypothetical protein